MRHESDLFEKLQGDLLSRGVEPGDFNRGVGEVEVPLSPAGLRPAEVN
jgi:hypothetical protein